MAAAAPFPLPSFPSWSSVFFFLLVVAHNRNYGCCPYRNRTLLNSGFLYGQLVRRQYTWLHVETLFIEESVVANIC